MQRVQVKKGEGAEWENCTHAYFKGFCLNSAVYWRHIASLTAKEVTHVVVSTWSFRIAPEAESVVDAT